MTTSSNLSKSPPDELEQSWEEIQRHLPTSTDASDPAEPDLVWRGYSGWAMLPSFLICIVLSGVLLSADWFITSLRVWYVEIGVGVLILIVAIWLFQVVRWGYRRITYTYRLTPNYLFIDRGFLYPRESPVELARVTEIVAGGNWLDRLLNVGWVRITAEENQEPVTLTGIWRPKRFAADLTNLARQARERKAK